MAGHCKIFRFFFSQLEINRFLCLFAFLGPFAAKKEFYFEETKLANLLKTKETACGKRPKRTENEAGYVFENT